VYVAIRQGKAKAGMAEELTRRIKEGAIPTKSAATVVIPKQMKIERGVR
jgi:hypothetical protein